MTTPKIALITGGSRGLGKSIALNLARKGVDVVLTYRTKQAEADATVAEIEALGQKAAAIQLDTGAIQTFDGFFGQMASLLKSHFGTDRFDFLINNAGNSVSSLIAETTEAQYDEIVNVHFKGVFFLTQKALPLLNSGGRIVNMSSVLGRITYPGQSLYGSMKAAVEIFTRYLATELGSRGITANVIAPGGIETDFNGGAMRDQQLQEYAISITALGRVGQPDDVGKVVAFLCSEESEWINGQRIEVSGGQSLS